jgi:hypothetical protein
LRASADKTIGECFVRLLFVMIASAAALACSPPRTAVSPVAPAFDAAAPAPVPPRDPAAHTQLSCDWPGFAANASVSGLAETFGAANVQAMDGEEGQVPVLIYPNDSTRRVRVTLSLGLDRSFSGAAVEDRASAWTIPGGIGMGATLADVARANGRPFKVFLYAGGASGADWQGGALGAGRCSYFVTFEHADKAIKEPRTLSSGDPAIQALALKVTRFGVN